MKGEADGRAGRSRASSTLVVLQMALPLLLLISSGLFLRSLQGATEIDPGFAGPRNLVMASVDPGLQGYDELRARDFFDRITDELRALPGVAAVDLTNSVPLDLGSSDRSVSIPGYELAEGERSRFYYATVSDGYLEAMGIEILEGAAPSPGPTTRTGRPSSS